MEKLKIYISGAITDNPDYEKQFKEAENELKEKYKNSIIISPLETAKELQDAMERIGMKWDLKWTDYIIFGLMKLKECNTIYVLPNSENSYGCKIERLFAEKLGIKEIEAKNEKI